MAVRMGFVPHPSGDQVPCHTSIHLGDFTFSHVWLFVLFLPVERNLSDNTKIRRRKKSYRDAECQVKVSASTFSHEMTIINR